MKVGLFIPCYIDQFFPQAGIAAFELLKKLGCDVDYPTAQTCCGQPMANSGNEEDAKKTYKHYVRTFRDYDYIVAPSGSCTNHVRKHYDNIEQSPDVIHVRKNTLDFPEFLIDVLKIESLDAHFPYKVGLHQSCHGHRGLKLAKSSELVGEEYSKIRTLLNMVKGIELINLDRTDECCGFGGTFSVKEPEISIKMGIDRIDDHLRNKAEVITGGDMSCLMHMQGISLRRKDKLRYMHLVEILNHT
ncbi:MAG: (Fe-S)-binding protein [Bacteroidetes bacterium]|nr:MAG: (Fe-S)-binding protein [Bacteroidota bacterium]